MTGNWKMQKPEPINIEAFGEAKRIIVVDPWARGVRHEMINAGWVSSLSSLASNVTAIEFYFSPSHYLALRKVLGANFKKNSRMSFFPLWMLKPRAILVNRFGRKMRNIFLVLSNPALVCKEILSLKPVSEIFYVAHGEKEHANSSADRFKIAKSTLWSKQGRRNLSLTGWSLYERITSSFERVLTGASLCENLIFQGPKAELCGLPHSSTIYLSAHIRANLLGEEVSGNFVNLPFLFASEPLGVEPKNSQCHRLSFMTIGNGNEQNLSELLGLIYQRLGQSAAGKLEITALSMNTANIASYPFFQAYRGGRLSRKLIEDELRRCNFLVYLYPHDSYARSASGSQLEAFRYRIPYLGLRNPHLEFLNDEFGQTGKLFDDVKSLANQIISYTTRPDLAVREWQKSYLAFGRARPTYRRRTDRDVRALFG